MAGRSKTSTKIQAILFSKKYYDKNYAKKWIKKHKIKPIKIHETERYIRFRIREPKRFIKTSFRIKPIKKGIKLIIGKLIKTKK